MCEVVIFCFSVHCSQFLKILSFNVNRGYAAYNISMLTIICSLNFQWTKHVLYLEKKYLLFKYNGNDPRTRNKNSKKREDRIQIFININTTDDHVFFLREFFIL